MTDRVYPSSKPKTATANTNTNTNTTSPKPTLPPPPAPNKTKPHNSTTKTNTNINRHPYRPNPTTNNQTRRRSRCGCFCVCCFWSILIIILLLLIATVAGCIFYLLYHPTRPTFSIAALKIHEFNLKTTNDDTTTLTSKLNLTISTKNPNKRVTFYYDPFTITCLSDETVIANGSYLHSLVTTPNNITMIRSTLSSKSVLMETQSVNDIKSHLKRKSGLPMKIFLDTKARVKIESSQTKKVGIRIKCDGIHSLIPKSDTGKSRNSSSYVSADVFDVKCRFDLRIKIWKWTF